MELSLSFYRDNASLNPFLGVVKVVAVFHWWFLVFSLSPMLSLLFGFSDGLTVMRVLSYSLFSTPNLDLWDASYVVTFKLASDYVAQKGSWCIVLSCFDVVGSWCVDLFSCQRSSSFTGYQNLDPVFTKVHTPLFFFNLVSLSYAILLDCAYGAWLFNLDSYLLVSLWFLYPLGWYVLHFWMFIFHFH